MNETILLMRKIAKTYGITRVLNEVNFDVRKGEVHALIGENGAGKSTLIKILSGAVMADKGEIILNGVPEKITTPYIAHEKGISVVHQELAQALDMSVAENIYMGRFPRTKLKTVDYKKLYRQVEEIMEPVDAEINPRAVLRNLSIAKRQMVEIAKAISYHSRIIVFDEPTSSLTEAEAIKLFAIIKSLRDKGVSIIYISHRMDEVFDLSDRISVLRDGKLVKTLIKEETNRDEVISLMIGRKLENMYPEHQSCDKGKLLEVNALSSEYVKDINFELHRGEILGFGGLVGAGRTELMRAIIGLDKHTGIIKIDGKQVRIQSVREALKNKISYLTEERKDLGLVMIFEIYKNITLSTLKGHCGKLFLKRRMEKETSAGYMKKMHILAPDDNTLVQNLSGGNQQKVLLSRCLASNPEILILDEPTRGVDVGAKSEIYQIIIDLAAKGVAIILVSSDLPELISLSDRVIVMCEGKITGTLQKEEISENRVMQYAVGGDKK